MIDARYLLPTWTSWSPFFCEVENCWKHKENLVALNKMKTNGGQIEPEIKGYDGMLTRKGI